MLILLLNPQNPMAIGIKKEKKTFGKNLFECDGYILICYGTCSMQATWHIRVQTMMMTMESLNVKVSEDYVKAKLLQEVQSSAFYTFNKKSQFSILIVSKRKLELWTNKNDVKHKGPDVFTKTNLNGNFSKKIQITKSNKGEDEGFVAAFPACSEQQQ